MTNTPKQKFFTVANELLASGYQVRFQASGHSMRPAIKDGDVIVVEPLLSAQPRHRDIFLYDRGGKPIAHRLVGVKNDEEVFILRGDSSDENDAPVQRAQLLGRVVTVERANRVSSLIDNRARATYWFYLCALFCRDLAQRLAPPIAIATTMLLIMLMAVPVQAQTCASAGKDGAGGTLTGVVNTYYPGTNSPAAGTKSITLGTATGATTPIAIGDLLLVIQMQNADIDTSNDGTYGDGGGSTTGTGSGVTSNSAGFFEYVVATSAVTTAGGTLTITGTGTGGGLINGYSTAAATTTKGQHTFQVIRVPEYTTATLSSGLTASAWNGSTGGVLAIDVAGVLTLGGTVSVSGLGFRGGGGRALTGVTSGATDRDYLNLSSINVHASKGEGIVGTPHYIYNASTNTITNTGAEGYPGGSYARGAPGNAGGGGTDGNVGANDQNAGGGGGANCGKGGNGGNAWSSQETTGGFGGAALTNSVTQIFLGGGGGAGDTNNGTDSASSDTSGKASSGATGGGIVMIRAGSVTGTGTISANGADAPSVLRDGAGGGGAGGTVLVIVNTGTLTGLTINANGGDGGDAWIIMPPGGDPGERHGPGGGGGGGAILTSTNTITARNSNGGAHGRTTTVLDAYGSTDGTVGCTSTVTEDNIPGIDAGFQCLEDVQLTISNNPGPMGLVKQGDSITYTIVVTNNGGLSSTNTTVTDPLPASVTYQSSTTTNGTKCTVSGGTVTCPLGTLAVGASVTITIVVKTTTPTTLNNTASVTTTPFEANLVNNSASAKNAVSFPTDVQLRSFSAVLVDGKTYLQWKTGREVNNLGFHLYREINGQRQRLTNGPLAGSALMIGDRIPLAAGPSYGLIDDLSDVPEASSGALLVSYWLEQIDLDGQHTWYGPVQAVPSSQQLQAFRVSPKLADYSIKADAFEQHNFAAFNSPNRTTYAITAAQMNTQWTLAGQATLKISVNKNGWYVVKQADLMAAGLSSRLDPRRLRLFADGIEQPIKVFGETDGSFDATDYIEFYGTGIDTSSSDTHIYWLLADTTPGLRIKDVQDITRTLPAAGGNFLFTVERHDRQVYFAALKNGDDDNFFGPILTSSPVSQTLMLQHIDSSAAATNATLEVSLQGVTDIPTQNPDHRVQISVNGIPAGTAVFDGQTLTNVKLSVRVGSLHEGANTVTYTTSNSDTDIVLLNYVRLTYPHTYTADNDQLEFTALSGKQIKLTGFSSNDIRVIDITNPALLQEIIVPASREDGVVGFAVPPSGTHRFLAFVGSAASAPSAIKLNSPSKWHDRSNSGEIVMLSHANFIASLAPLKALRTAQGRSVAVIDVEDIYDEYNFGVKSPQAIRDFLIGTHTTWTKPAKFLLLVGDASFDPRNYLGFGETDFVPTKTVATDALETASDDWFGDFNNDDLADIAVGRLSCRTPEEATLIVNKIGAFEQALKSSPAGSWRDQVLMIADTNDVFDFSGSMTKLATLLPTTMKTTNVFLDNTDFNTARQQVISNMNSGKLIVNYFGHGSVEVWTKESLLSSEDAYNLNNGNRLSFVIVMNCLNGFFHDLYTESLAEALQRAPQGGAAAVWASSSLTEAPDQATLNQQLYKEIFANPTTTIGEAIMRAKRVITNKDIQKSWNLFGDPAMKSKISNQLASYQLASYQQSAKKPLDEKIFLLLNSLLLS